MTRARPRPEEGRVPEGQVVTPRPSASLLLLRGGAEAIEVLLVRRTPAARFMGGFWVFPGGSVDPGDREGAPDEEAAHRAAAVRELAEEASIEGVDPDALAGWSRWVTPERAAIRFDTRFYLGPAPEGATARVDGEECVDAGWFAPEAALGAYDRGALPLAFPTLKQIEQLAPLPTADAALAAARGRTVEPVLPQVLGTGEDARIVMPGEPGYVD